MAIPSTLDSVYRHIRKSFEGAGLATPDLDARLMIRERAGLDWAEIIARPETELSTEVLGLLEADTARRLAGEPISRIYGRRGFWGLEFEVTPDTLDPRPDTETLIEQVLRAYKDAPPGRILDLGTGTGCILIALLKEFPQAQGVAVDISPGALAAAKRNAARNGVDGRCAFYQGDWADALPDAEKAQKFDLIVSNPPYISNQTIPNLAPEVRNHDPILALDGGNDGLDAYKKIIYALPELTKNTSKVFFEIGFDQEKSLMRLVGESPFSLLHVHLDSAGLPRVVEISCGDK